MKTFWISVAASAVMSAITAAVILLAVDRGGDPAPAATMGTAATELVERTAARDSRGSGTVELVEIREGDEDWEASHSATASAPPRDVDGESAAATTAAPFSPSAVFEAVAPSVVSVETDFGAGSGFFVDDEGHVVTNLHVVEDSRRIWVWTNAGERAAASLEGSDWGNDLAVLKVDPDGLTFEPAELGDGSALAVGHEVAAIGAPGGRSLSLTTGVVSGLDRRRLRDGRMAHQMIQSDAAINPGNSGGVLANGDGEVIGVTSLIDSPVGAFTGVGYSVSVDTLKRVLARMIDGEEISHPRLGVVLTSAQGDLRVAEVSEGDPAKEAGVEADDVIVSLGGEQLAEFADLVAALESLRSGEETTIVVERDGERMSLEIELREWERVRQSRRTFSFP